MILSAIGRIIDEEWLNTPVIRPNVVLDEYQIMPNHMHLIVYIPEAPTVIARAGGPLVRPPRSLASLMGQFKASVTRRVRELLRNPRYDVWQRGFHDKVIRNEEALEGIQTYIRNNPAEWATDPHNPAVR
jgi:putative transposase